MEKGKKEQEEVRGDLPEQTKAKHKDIGKGKRGLKGGEEERTGRKRRREGREERKDGKEAGEEGKETGRQAIWDCKSA